MARNTTNLTLRVWDQYTDAFSHTELAANWDKIDAHDHSTGKGLPIPTAGIRDGAVTTAKLAASAVTAAKIQSGAVQTAKLADGAVTGAKIAAGTLTVDRIAATAAGSRLGLTSVALVNTLTAYSTTAALKFDSLNYGFNTWYSAATGLWTPQTSGYYRVTWSVYGGADFPAATFSWGSKLNQNGAVYSLGSDHASNGVAKNKVSNGTSVIFANGTTDNFSVQATISDTAGTTPTTFNLPAAPTATFFTAEYIGP